MARPVSDEELQLKRRARRRLIGAIVLVAAIVVVLPMVLDTDAEAPRRRGEHQDSLSRFQQVQLAHGAGSAIGGAPLGGRRKGRDGHEIHAEVRRGGRRETCGCRVARACPQGATRTQAPAVRSGRSPQAGRSAGRVPSRRGSGYAVQVVALADAEKVKAVQAQMAAAGLQSYTEVVKTAKGDVTRVRAGPYPDRAAAEKAHDQLKALGLPGNIVAK